MIPVTDMRTSVRTELERLEEDILYTEKAHFAAAEGLQRLHLIVGLIATITASATSVSIVADGPVWISAPFALTASIAAAVLTFLKPDERAAQHLGAGRNLGDARVQSRQHRELDLHEATTVDTNEWRGYADAIRTSKKETDDAAPALSQRHFESARRKIEGGDFEHVTDS